MCWNLVWFPMRKWWNWFKGWLWYACVVYCILLVCIQYSSILCTVHCTLYTYAWCNHISKPISSDSNGKISIFLKIKWTLYMLVFFFSSARREWPQFSFISITIWFNKWVQWEKMAWMSIWWWVITKSVVASKTSEKRNKVVPKTWCKLLSTETTKH